MESVVDDGFRESGEIEIHKIVEEDSFMIAPNYFKDQAAGP